MSTSKPKQDKPLALVIDDDLSMRIAMHAALAKSGFEVLEAESGEQGVELFQNCRPDLILLDVVMPEVDGYETCSQIRSLPSGRFVQILMVTGLDDTDSIERAFEVGASGFIAKPINWAMLGHRGKYMVRAGRAFQELDRSKSRLAKTQELAQLGNWEIDLISNDFSCSVEARKLLGIEEKSAFISFDSFFATIVDEEKKVVEEKIKAALSAKKSYSINYRIAHPDGTERYILNHGETVLNDFGEPELMLGAVQDVTQLKKAEEEIRYLAFYDGLTGLANRMLFHDRLNQEIQTAHRHGQSFALLYLDLDQFKRINDTFGHHIGDQLLKKVSAVLQKCIRSSDSASRMCDINQDAMIARLGGDEFTIILSDIKEPENAALVAKRIIKEIPAPFFHEGHEIASTTSIGISIYPTDGTDANELLKHADTAMYQAKTDGRNNYQFFEKSLNVATVERFSLEQDIAKAITNDEFKLVYQPKIDVQTRSIIGAEALIRWHHPQRGIVPPDTFISIAEESGQIIEINKFVIKTASKQWQQWLRDGFDPGIVAVNLSGYQFARQNIIATINEGLQDAELDPEYLEIEITENILMQDIKQTADVLQEIKEMGVRIALDDFGTGYSSLSYLATYPVDTIKIDRSFVQECTSNPNNIIIIKAIIALGHSLGMKIVAEGVEQDEEFTIIRKFGADEAQGYFFAKPLPPNDFVKLLTSKTL